jgi:SNF2 family DNA or RNA helicase
MKIPKQYQETAIELAVKHNTLEADKVGLGKTLVAIEAAKRLRVHGRLWRALVICPKRIRDQWVAEIGEQDPGYPITVLQPGLPLGFQIHPNKRPSGWIIIHYDLVPRMVSDLADYVWDVVVADEAHRLSNRRNKWTAAIKQVIGARKIAMTGTPMEKSAADIWSICNWLYPSKFTSYWLFKDKFVRTIMLPSGFEKIVGNQNQKALAELLGPFMIRRTREQVDPEFPPMVTQEVPIAMDSDQAVAYKKFEEADDIVVNLDEYNLEPMVIKNVLERMVRLQQLSSLPQLLGITTSAAKIEWVRDWLKDNPDEPVVVFSRFRGVVEHLSKMLTEPHDIVMGGVQGLPERFMAGQVRITLGTIDAMGEGMNLQRARFAIFVDSHWSSRIMEQALGRIHRGEITESRHAYLLYCKGTVDKLVLDAVTRKWDENELVHQVCSFWSQKNTH